MTLIMDDQSNLILIDENHLSNLIELFEVKSDYLFGKDGLIGVVYWLMCKIF